MAGLDFEIPKCYAMFKDSTPKSDNPADPGTGFFNLVMEDLNNNYLPFSSAAGKTPTLEQHTVSMQAFKSMHTKFFEWSDPRFTSAPLSFSGGDFKWLDWQPLVGMFGQTWPAVKQYMPIFSGYLNPETGEGKYETEQQVHTTQTNLLPFGASSLSDRLRAPAVTSRRVGPRSSICTTNSLRMEAKEQCRCSKASTRNSPRGHR